MKISTYAEAKEYLESFIRPHDYKYAHLRENQDIISQRARQFLQLLGNPQDSLKSVQVSGTSGKTSTAYMTARILTVQGYKTGLTISPHLESLTERIQINGVQISKKEYIQLLNSMLPTIQRMSKTRYGAPSYYEILLAMAFVYFKSEKVDIVIAEVGLEGRFDMTNFLTPFIAVISTISLDHTELLGETVEKIALEATTIIKNTPMQQIVITAATKPTVLKIITDRCEKNNARLIQIGKDVKYLLEKNSLNGSIFSYQFGGKKIDRIQLSTIGIHQVQNATLAITVCLMLSEYGYTMSDTSIRNALCDMYVPGRFEIRTFAQRKIILDGAHNTEKMSAFVAALSAYYPKQKIVFILAFKKDKDRTIMLEKILPITDTIIITQFHATTDMAKNSAMLPRVLQGQIENLHSNVKIISTDSVREALNKVVTITTADTIIAVTGSLYLVGEVRGIVGDGDEKRIDVPDVSVSTE